MIIFSKNYVLTFFEILLFIDLIFWWYQNLPNVLTFYVIVNKPRKPKL